jgi:hypothetical protein
MWSAVRASCPGIGPPAENTQEPEKAEGGQMFVAVCLIPFVIAFDSALTFVGVEVAAKKW